VWELGFRKGARPLKEKERVEKGCFKDGAQKEHLRDRGCFLGGQLLGSGLGILIVLGHLCVCVKIFFVRILSSEVTEKAHINHYRCQQYVLISLRSS